MERTAVHHVTDNDLYTFVIEEFDLDGEPRLLAHIHFKQFSPLVFKRVLRDWALFRKCCQAPLFAFAGTEDVKTWEHFISRLGFKPTDGEVICNNGEKRRLYLSTQDVFRLPTIVH